MIRSLPRRVVSAAAVGVAAAALAGCQVASPIVTDYEYDPAEGFSIETDAFTVRNALVVSEGDGAAGVLSGLLANRTSEPLAVQIQLGPPEAPTVTDLEVPANSSVRLDGMPVSDLPGSETVEASPVQIAAVDVATGGLYPVQVTAGGDIAAESVPVLPPEGYFADVLPTTP